MAVRRPLFYDGSSIKEMTSAMVTEIQTRCVYAYGSNPSALLTVVGSSGTLSSMTDTRKQAGAGTESFGDGDGVHGDGGDFPSSSASSTITGATFDKISQVNATVSAPTDTNNKLYPVYYDGSGTIQAMTATDMFDTFFTQAIDLLVDGSDRAGTFRIHTATSLSDHTLIGGPVFTDTRANAAAYTSGGIPETRDQPQDITNYYLFRTNQGTAPAITQPLQITTGNDLQAYPLTSFDAMLLAELRHYTVNTSGSKITYSINGSGNNRGSGMVDTKLDGNNPQTRIVGTSGQSDTVYRSQQFPSGTPQTISTYFLKIVRS
tara:strand:+ start:21209 stop:22165 length:957 start_codon:yes stop_codon:yes gene_type:complete